MAWPLVWLGQSATQNGAPGLRLNKCLVAGGSSRAWKPVTVTVTILPKLFLGLTK